ncbi:MAG: histidine kinase [Eubacteriales bacterium]|nr:histidine kinase [Eubacteriales bacterium]
MRVNKRIRHYINNKRHSLTGKIGGVCILVNILVFVMDLVLLVGINTMSGKIEQVYLENVNLNVLSEALSEVQDSVNIYLSMKTTESLENYYRSVQNYEKMVDTLSNQITGATHDRMEKSIRNMSAHYLELTNQTIEAKRGRNVVKYRAHFENATEMYEYINTYINSLNNQQLEANSENYVILSQKFRVFEMICMCIMVIVMIGNIAITLKLLGTMIRPLTKLAGLADNVAEGNFDIELLEVNSRDEIETVTNAFNSMILSIRNYITQIRLNMEREQASKERELKMEANLKEAELKYLQAQINPHFLFNTLNAGAQLAMMEDAERTYEYIQNTAEIFRYTVRKGEEIVTIADELQLVDHYIFVLNVRFAGDIHYHKSVDESLLNIQMPSMILQPIVENCVNHGIREMEGNGQIHLSVYKKGDKICISIKDNGVGMSEETIAKVMKGEWKNLEHQGNSNGVGVDNVIERMHLYTQNEESIQILSDGENLGTEVILLLNDKETEENHV